MKPAVRILFCSAIPILSLMNMNAQHSILSTLFPTRPVKYSPTPQLGLLNTECLYDSIHSYSVQTGTEEYHLSSRYYFEYDENGNMLFESLMDGNNSGGWKWIREYDANDNLITCLRSDWNGFFWADVNRFFYEYDANNNLIQTVTEAWINESWMERKIEEREYDDNGNLISLLEIGWSDFLQQWENNSLLTYAYNEDNVMISELYQLYELGEFLNNYKIEWEFDIQDNLLSWTKSEYSDDTWLVEKREDMTYDENNQLITLVSIDNTDVPFWVYNDIKLEFTYNISSDLESETVSYLDGSTWFERKNESFTEGNNAGNWTISTIGRDPEIFNAIVDSTFSVVHGDISNWYRELDQKIHLYESKHTRDFDEWTFHSEIFRTICNEECLALEDYYSDDMEFNDRDIYFCSGSVSVNELSKVQQESYMVYPNPSDGNFTLDNSKIHQNCVVRLFDANGRLIDERNLNKFPYTWNSDLDAGVYFLQLMDDTGLCLKKMIVQQK